MDPDAQVSQDQGSAWLNFALTAQCKQRPAGTRTMSRVNLPTVAELKDKANAIISQRQVQEEQQRSDDSDAGSEDSPWIKCKQSLTDQPLDSLD